MRIFQGLAGLGAVAATTVLVISGCGGGTASTTQQSQSIADCATAPNTCNSGKAKHGGSVTYTIEKTITGWNVLDANSNTFEFREVVGGVLPAGPFLQTPDLKYTLNTDLMVSAEQTSTNPQTIVYKIRPEATWSDGTPIGVDDFTWLWKTQDGKDCAGCAAATTSGYDQISSITGADGGKTVTVVFTTPYTDWRGLFGTMYPAHVANTLGSLAAGWKYLDATRPTYSGGPYQIGAYQKDVSVTLTPNPKWYGRVKPSLDKVVFRIITDQTQEVPALQNNEVQAIYPQPNADIISQVKQINGVQSYVGKGLVWEHIDLNLKNPVLTDLKLRQALFTAISRKDIIAKTIGQFVPGAQPLNSHNFVPGMNGYKDTVTSTGQGDGDVAKAKQMLTGAGYTGVGTALKTPGGKDVVLRMAYTQGNVLRQQTCELVQNELAALGIKVTVTPVVSLGKTLASGDYDMIIFAWVNTPSIFSSAYQFWYSTSGSNYGHWVNPQSDQLLKDAASQTDAAKAIAELQQQDAILSNDAYVLPLFQKPTYLAAYSNIVNMRDNATSVGPPYNDQEWGIR
jgi:peptide/nickel transport system substrate-binding protein